MIEVTLYLEGRGGAAAVVDDARERVREPLDVPARGKR